MAAAGFTAPVQVPVFVDGQAFREFEETRRVDITPRALLFGAILNAHEDPPAVDTRPFREALSALLEALARDFQSPSMEELLLDVAAVVRKDHGGDLSRRALENTIALFPSFHRARSDLVADLWVEAGRASGSSRTGLLASLLEEFRRLDMRSLDAGPRAFVCYAAVAATAVTRGKEPARQLLSELAADIEAGDEGSLAKNLAAFLAGDATDWSMLAVSME
jgi:hypothetical protein